MIDHLVGNLFGWDWNHSIYTPMLIIEPMSLFFSTMQEWEPIRSSGWSDASDSQTAEPLQDPPFEHELNELMDSLEADLPEVPLPPPAIPVMLSPGPGREGFEWTSQTWQPHGYPMSISSSGYPMSIRLEGVRTQKSCEQQWFYGFGIRKCPQGSGPKCCWDYMFQTETFFVQHDWAMAYFNKFNNHAWEYIKLIFKSLFVETPERFKKTCMQWDCRIQKLWILVLRTKKLPRSRICLFKISSSKLSLHCRKSVLADRISAVFSCWYCYFVMATIVYWTDIR